MRKVIATMVVLTMISPVQAKVINCIGIDHENNTIKVIADGKTNKMIINGGIFSGTKFHSFNNKSGGMDVIQTKNFINLNDRYVYNQLGIFTKGKYSGDWFLTTNSVATNKSISFINLSCSIDND